MEKLRILGFDDDNHTPCFRREDGKTFVNCQELVAFLSKPHDYEVEVKMFAIVDEWTPALEALGEEAVDMMFYFLEGCGRQPEWTTLEEAFNLFWEAANRLYW
jgi:hypothetical protein